jgi:hypothetical protein
MIPLRVLRVRLVPIRVFEDNPQVLCFKHRWRWLAFVSSFMISVYSRVLGRAKP